jgi:formylglycine-generating enzyme
MIPIDAGSFEMGCTEGQSGCESDESPVHTVHLTRDFYMAETEVTQAQWESVMGSNPSANLWCGESCPVESVSWGQAIAFANTLSELEGLTPAYAENDETYSLDLDADGYRLPTEAEWEFAARCGTDLRYAGSDDADEVARYNQTSDGSIRPVAGRSPNGCGLYDMSGNVYEWVWDRFGEDYYDGGEMTDPTGPATGDDRVYRGGAWDSPSCHLPSSVAILVSSSPLPSQLPCCSSGEPNEEIPKTERPDAAKPAPPTCRESPASSGSPPTQTARATPHCSAA